MTGISGYLSAELAASCNALGYYDGKQYHLEPHCRETLRDLILYLRRDASSHEIRRYLGNAKLLKTDLLPIIQCHCQELDLFDVALRLVVNLTNPALLVYNEVVPADKCEHNQFLELLSHLQTYKEAFNDHKVWTPFTDRLGALLHKPTEDRDEDDQRTIERILILIRNVLHVPASASFDWRPDNDASIHDQVIWALHQSGMLDILLYMASSENEANFYLHLLEIICLMIREQPPALLAQTTALRSEDEKFRDEQELLKLRQAEIQDKIKKQKKYLGTRHSNFGGTFVVKNMKSTSNKDMIYHKRIQEEKYITFDQEKQKSRTPRNKQALQSNNAERRSALSVRLVLKQFCVEILHAVYNPLMRHVRECVVRGKNQDNDETYYFTALKFFMEFNRFYKFQVKFVSETMAVETFHFVQKYLENWYEMMATDKKKLKLWSFRMHLAMKAYKELLQNLILMDRSQDPGVRESSKVIKSNIFYVLEYREMLLVLAKSYKKHQFSKQYLVDLMETIHIFLKLLCDFCKNKKIMVQRKQTIRKRKKNKKSTPQPAMNFEAMWDENENQISSVLNSEISKEVIPFDATLEMDMEQQKFEAVKRIHSLLISGSFEEAVALFRASREVWPENGTFGTENSSREEELANLKEVFLADLGSGKQVPEEVEEESLDEEEEHIPQVLEQNFEIMDLLKRFASPKIVHICCQLLEDFETNSDFTNRCVVKMLHRIAWDCKLPTMLFQASLFIKFQKILRANNPKYNELSKLAIFVTRKFVETAQKNKLVYVELLFLKNVKESVEIEEGYGTTNDQKSKKGFWEEHEEEELRTLSMEYDQKSPSEPMVDWIMDNMIRKDRSKRAVVKKLKEMYLLVDNRPPKKSNKWTEEHDEELKSLYSEFKDAEDPLTSISERLSEDRSRQAIASALLRLGLIQDKKDVYKKKKRTNNKSRDAESDPGTEIEDSESEDEGRRVEEPVPKLAPTVKTIFEVLPDKKFLVEGLKWISSCIDDCLEDIDDEDSTDVPLLPLLEDSMLSVEDPQFQNFLSSLNFKKPSQGEVYWRIPASWKAPEFNSRKALVNYIAYNFESDLPSCAQDINNHILSITGEVQDVLAQQQAVENRSDFDHFSSLIAKHCKDALSKELPSSPSDSEPEMKNSFRERTSRYSESDEDEPATSFTNFNQTARRRLLSDSDDESNKGNEKENVPVSQTSESRMAKRSRRSESDDEATIRNNTSENKQAKRSKRLLSESDDESVENNQNLVSEISENKLTKRSKRLLSESDDESVENNQNLVSEISENKQTKRSKRLLSESDDESNNSIENNTKNAPLVSEISGCKVAKRSRRLSSESDEATIEDNKDESQGTELSESKGTQRSKLSESDDESKSSGENHQNGVSEIPEDKLAKRSRRLLSESDDESNNSVENKQNEENLVAEKSEKLAKRSRRFISDSDDEKESKRDRDSEDEDNLVKKKKRVVIESDEE